MNGVYRAIGALNADYKIRRGKLSDVVTRYYFLINSKIAALCQTLNNPIMDRKKCKMILINE